ncbi:MAG: hypothetical protein KC468_36910, partial [Myxococcales bacterium]|nr:hypothetical protein [Myxococcales bacterium]
VNDASQSEQRGLENPAHPVDKARAIAPSPVAKKTPRSKPKRVPTSTIKSKLMRLKKRCKDHRLMIPVTVTLGLKVEPSGAVSDVVAQGAGLVKGAPLYDCMLDTAKKISFKPSLEGHPDRVEASFVVPKR